MSTTTRRASNADSVAFGISNTGRLITGAALIMVAVFGGFALGRLADLQQTGLGLAVAVLLDATIVRMVLVPASMRLLGEKNWYLPHWLQWLPRIGIEAPSATDDGETPPAPEDDRGWCRRDSRVIGTGAWHTSFSRIPVRTSG